MIRFSQRYLDDLLEVVGRGGGRGAPEQLSVADPQRPFEPTGVDRDQHNEHLEAEQQVHCLEDADDLLRRASIQVVDDDDDALQRGRYWVRWRYRRRAVVGIRARGRCTGQPPRLAGTNSSLDR
jgi:hypothetical protein